jgi:hypothetical protein
MNLLLGQDRWSVEVAIEEAVAADVIAGVFHPLALATGSHLCEKILSAARFGLGDQVEGQAPIDCEKTAARADGHHRHA